jgi:hypothetical protein
VRSGPAEVSIPGPVLESRCLPRYPALAASPRQRSRRTASVRCLATPGRNGFHRQLHRSSNSDHVGSGQAAVGQQYPQSERWRSRRAAVHEVAHWRVEDVPGAIQQIRCGVRAEHDIRAVIARVRLRTREKKQLRPHIVSGRRLERDRRSGCPAASGRLAIMTQAGCRESSRISQ